jgi:formylglycine-generating enzyme required for sulfatase activity
MAAKGSDPPGEARDPDEIVRVPFRPSATSAQPRERRRGRRLTVAVWGFGVILGVLAWFSFTAVPVRIAVQPDDADVALPGTLFKFWLGDHYLLRPVEHTVHIEREGYVAVDTTIQVDYGPDQRFRFSLTKLPGRLRIETSPVADALVRIDGEELGTTPFVSPELSPGPHRVEVVAERYVPFAETIEVEGAGVEQPLEIELSPGWAIITLQTSPPGATVRVDGEERGTTPGAFDILAGERTLDILLAGYNPWTQRLVVEADQPQTLPDIVLREADAQLELVSQPPGAQVSLGTEYRGVTPLTLSIPSGETHELTLFKPGYDVAVRSVELAPGETGALDVRLKARLGIIELVTEPEGARLEIDGRPSGSATQRLTLVAVPHRLVITKDGYAAHETQVTPREGASQRVEVRLQTEAEHRAARRSRAILTKRGQRLVLVPAGSFVMGSSRRERGRRPNEVLRSVELTRPYYLGIREISNREFREFLPSHRSGRVAGHDLNTDAQPVVSVSWEHAARFCNWLSVQESLPPAYVERGGRLVLVRPVPASYRLPTEAEWVWAARFAGGRADLRFPWGGQLTPPADAGNYADSSASAFLKRTLPAYTDGFPVSAPVVTGAANALGLLRMGDNVAEWVSDAYTIYPATPLSTLVRDPLGPASGQHHVLRGASWRTSSLAELRLAFRDYGDSIRDDVGFRIARSVD